MGKSRKANRGWRARLNKNLENSPELQAQVKALAIADVNAQIAQISDAQTQMTARADYLQSELERLQGEPEPATAE